MRRIRLTVGKTSATFELTENIAPKTTRALWDSLPIEESLTHAKWAGSACWLKTDRGPIASDLEATNEHPVTSIYQGYMVVRPHQSGRGEIFISYGVAESRYVDGRTYVTPVAHLEDDAPDFLQALADTWTKGATRIRIERIDGSAQA